jgi:hypothetical protein
MALAKVEKAIPDSQRTHVDDFHPIHLPPLPTVGLPTGVLGQVLEWLHLLHSPARVITPYHYMVSTLIPTGCFCTVQLLGLEPSLLVVPFSKEQ